MSRTSAIVTHASLRSVGPIGDGRRRDGSVMIRRIGQNLGVGPARVPAASRQLETDGYAVLRGVFTANQVARLRREIDEVFRTTPAERYRADAAQFRYEMLNRSAAAQAAVANRRILAAIEP